VPPVSATRRLLLVAGMAGFFICALAIPRAFVDTGLAFGLGYLLVVLVHGGLYAQVHGRAVVRFVPFNVGGALCVIAASWASGALVYVLWAAPIALQYLAASITSGVDESVRSGYDIRPAHFVERHGGLLIVVLGESVVGVGIGITDLALNGSTITTAVLGLLLAAALWWTYFGADEKRAEASLTAASMNERVRMALVGYFYAFVPMLLGITALAAGVKLTISTIEARLPLAPALLLGGGIALYLAGDALFRRTMHIPHSVYRIGAGAVALATIVLGMGASGLAQLAALVTILALMVALESRGRSEPVE
jgi:low temperature requirement protein LtrA